MRPMLKPAYDKDTYDNREVHMVNDNTDHKTLLKKMDHNPKAYFLFNPEKGHYRNALVLYNACKRQLQRKYYGLGTVKETDRLLSEEEAIKKAFKGTQFAKCSLPYEVFHLHRRTKLAMKQKLSRIGLLALRDGSLEVMDTHKE